jgi:tetratricopeptide (TPR) repeat protein
MRWHHVLPILTLFAGVPGSLMAAQDALPGFSAGGDARYQQCVDMTKRDAQNAYNQALAWHGSGGGDGAEHCKALALVQLQRYSEAAPLLDAMGQEKSLQNSARAQLYDQAGNAWLLAEDAGHADVSFSNALLFSSGDVEILADRARARAMRKDWSGAEADLTGALIRDPDRADLLVLRASARHAAGHKKEARADIDTALGIFPGYGDALVERGAMKFEDGDTRGAVADWQQVIKANPRSRAAALAGEYLSETDTSAKN